MAAPIPRRALARLCSFVVPVGLVLAAATAPLTPAIPASGGEVSIKVLSNRADLISGGDALIEVVLPPGADAAKLKVDVDGTDVTRDVQLRANGRVMGLLTGLAEKADVVTARLPDGSGAHLTIVNHPNGGPVFSGPQIMPWPCLTGALDAQCNRAVSYAYTYKSTNPAKSGFQAYDPANPATDVATTTTDEGHTVPYIVRTETGNQDRAQYRIAVLFDPTKPWAPWARQAGWNGKTYTTGGSGCGTHHGETAAPDVAVDDALRRGFMVFSTALDHNTQNCNLVVQAESLMMAKERIVEQYGPIRYAIGSGCSGGAIYQQQAANDYPGIFDGILPNCSFPDSWSTAVEVVDCRLLVNYFDAPNAWGAGVAWPPNQQAAVEGHPGPNICQSWINVYAFDQAANPRAASTALGLQSCNVATGVGKDKAYDPATNPQGVRCDLSTYFQNELGLRPDGTANRPADNVGVQYGLNALAAGTITPAQFVDLNTKIGGLDNDYTPQGGRTLADAPALPIAYRSGLFNQANNMHIPIIDLRGHDVAEIHHDYRSFVMRERLDKANGNHDNQVIWLGPVALVGDAAFATDALTAMDAWLAAIEADKSTDSYATKVKKNKPAAAHDRCTDGDGHDVSTDMSVCTTLFPYYAEPRMVAGEPFRGDILKCQLKPFSAADYKQTIPFTADQLATLQNLFKDGVCDYSKPSVGQQPTVPWLDYSAGPAGKDMGVAPVSVAFAGTTIDPFTFRERDDVPTGAYVTSEQLTLTGNGTGKLPIGIANGQYSVNGKPFTGDAGTAGPGDTLVVRHVSAAATNTVTVSSVTVGGYHTDFKSVTGARDHVPDAFDFGAQSNVEPGRAYTSQVVTPAHYDDAPVVAGQGVSYAIDGGPFTTAGGTITRGQSIRLRMISANSSLGYARGYVTIGGVRGTFTLRTRK